MEPKRQRGSVGQGAHALPGTVGDRHRVPVVSGICPCVPGATACDEPPCDEPRWPIVCLANRPATTSRSSTSAGPLRPAHRVLLSAAYRRCYLPGVSSSFCSIELIPLEGMA